MARLKRQLAQIPPYLVLRRPEAAWKNALEDAKATFRSSHEVLAPRGSYLKWIKKAAPALLYVQPAEEMDRWGD
jgi:hypothetical protein